MVIPTAGGADDYDQFYQGLRAWRAQGATNLTVLHTNDRSEADSDAFVQAIREASGVWLPGGRQWRLMDSYLDTKTEEELWNLLDRGGVIGGSSAGATPLGSYLVRGDTRTNQIMMGDHVEGWGFLTNSAIDQHLLKRNRQFDLIEVIEAHPELLGIGLDENTAIVVTGNEFEVIGQSYVAIFDNERMIGDHGFFPQSARARPHRHRAPPFPRPGARQTPPAKASSIPRDVGHTRLRQRQGDWTLPWRPRGSDGVRGWNTGLRSNRR